MKYSIINTINVLKWVSGQTPNQKTIEVLFVLKHLLLHNLHKRSKTISFAQNERTERERERKGSKFNFVMVLRKS